MAYAFQFAFVLSKFILGPQFIRRF